MGADKGYEQIVIERLDPTLTDGSGAVKAVVGDTITVEATVFRHGHERVRAAVQWRAPGAGTVSETPMTLINPGLDRWRCEVTLNRIGRYRMVVVGWTEVYASWVEELAKRIRARQSDVSSEIADGLSLIERVSRSQRGKARREVQALLERMRETAADPELTLELASADSTRALMARVDPRADAARSDPELVIVADRERARVGAWYKLFVRSQGTASGQSGTFRDAEQRLADIRRMGFDVVYLAPIHPIGRTNRKGADNSLEAAHGDPGSPWAIGSEHGGHTAIEPAIGTLEDFDRFVHVAGALDMEVALDFAIQCSPDHPWVHSIRSGSIVGPMAASGTRRIRRRSTRTSTPSISTRRTRRACGRPCVRSCCSGSPAAFGYSASTTRIPSPSVSGRG